MMPMTSVVTIKTMALSGIGGTCGTGAKSVRGAFTSSGGDDPRVELDRRQRRIGDFAIAYDANATVGTFDTILEH